MAKYVNRGKRQFSEREKRAYSAGRGYAAAKKGKRIKCNTEKEKQSFRNGVKSVTERAPAVAKKPKASGKTKTPAKPHYLGSTYVNGKFYDTNFKKPVEITRKQIAELRSSYENIGERATDKQIVDRYVNHMRNKYGVFDRRGNFLGMLGD